MKQIFLLLFFTSCFEQPSRPIAQSEGPILQNLQEARSPSQANKEKGWLLEDEKNTVQIYQGKASTVVNVVNTKVARTWDFERVEIPRGAGSGWVWDDQGHIVTNFHVVAQGDSFLISFKDDPKKYKAKFIGGEPRKDVAVLKLLEKPKSLNVSTIGASNNLSVGQKVIAIGNPFELDYTLTTGVVSALGRKIQGFGGVKIYNMIQTDASINPGNSGGPLLDSRGNVIGMNTQIVSTSGSSAGVGFAVPSDTIARLVPQIIKYGKIIRPGLGIGLLDDRHKRMFGIKDGIVIRMVQPGGPAASAGLKGMKRDSRGRYYLGDIILKIDNRKIDSYDDIYHALEKYKVGDTVTVEYLRDNKVKKTTIKLIELNLDE